jgi:tRNA(fMet)-specific endonuclease VapC
MRSSGVDGPRLILDTSAYSHLRAGHPLVLDAVATAEVVFLPIVVVGELEAAFELGSRERENRRVLSEFLAEPFVAVLPLTLGVARHYGRIFAELRRAGAPLPINDVWIAAMTRDCGGHLLTFDTDFGRVPALDCTILPV